MCMCVHMSISYMYTLAQTRIHTIHVNNTHGKRHLCTCTLIHTNTHMSGRSCSLVCVDVCTCLYVYHNAYVCMHVCIFIKHLYIDTDAPYTIHVYNIHAKKHMCTYTTIHTHAHMSGHSCSLSVWMCVRVYVCHKCACTCLCVYISISYMYTLKQTRVIHAIHVNNMHQKRHMCTCTMIHTNTLVSGRTCSLSVWMCVRVYICTSQ